MRFTTAFAAFSAVALISPSNAQQYAGDIIQNALPGVPGAEIAYWKIKDTKSSNLTLINYHNYGKNGKRQDTNKVKRAVVIIHGLNRDPGTYQSNMLSALAQVPLSEINTDSVAIVAPYFSNGADKNIGYPWVEGLKPAQGSISNALVWPGSQWSGGGNNQYPWTSSKNISSYTVLDQMIQYFDNKTMYPNLNQIVIAGHSLGGQTVQRYAAIGQPGNVQTPVSYWVGNPNSLNFTQYPMTYGVSLVASGRANILANFNSKAVNWARGTQDLGDDSSSCAPFTAGANRNERFFNFIKAFPVSCADSTSSNCDTVDFVNAGHDGGAMFASAAGQARLFIDNWSGNGSRAYDYGYPRQQVGDDPFPNPGLNGSSYAINNNTYAGNMTYQGCWSDQSIRTLSNMTYQGSANTIESCTAACDSGNNTIAGLESGNQCYCGSRLGYMAQPVIDSSCASPCTGNASEICGGGNRLSLFSNGSPIVNAPPGTPEVIGSDWYYSNCYTEGSGGARALAGKGASGNFMTLEYCASFCKGYQYFGTEYSSECYCGNSFGAGANITAASDCSMTCAADVTEFCGAGNRLTVYVNSTWTPSPSSSASTTSSAAGSSPTGSGPSCPASDATTVTSGGKNFTIECGIDHSGGDLTSLSVSGFQGCIDACAQNSQCVDVSLSGSACYLKSSLGAAVPNGGVWGAKLIVAGSGTTSSVSSTSTASASGSGSGSGSSSASTQTSSSASPIVSSSVSPSATSVVDCPSSNATIVVSNGRRPHISKR
ncbi:hypothetical protein LTR15_001951 [Elasticomyces elasticus]|nr:hypothetical protein LTR15_001951 [Elasticomyces elasticus]